MNTEEESTAFPLYPHILRGIKGGGGKESPCDVIILLKNNTLSNKKLINQIKETNYIVVKMTKTTNQNQNPWKIISTKDIKICAHELVK